MQTCRVTCQAAAVGVLGLLWVLTAAVTCPENCSCYVTQVTCIGRGLKDVPDNIPLDTTLISLNSNSIQNLSDANFANLTSLRYLYLEHNDIRVLPAGVFSHLTRLRWLDLRGNHIADLSEEVFSNLTSLERLFLSNNSFSSLPAGVFSHLTRLERLYLRDNHIADFPEEVFSNLTSLEELYLSSNNISSLPAGIFSHLTRLLVLDLSDNYIADLSEEVLSHLISLAVLHLSNNGISSLSAGVFSHLTRLVILDLTENHIADLPDEVFSNLTRLQSLDLYNNHIADLREEVFSHLTSLTHLNLFINNISSLPEEVFSNLTSLEQLSLASNNISSLPAGVFSHLTRLKWLELSGNPIADLPEEIFSHLTRLEWLHLSDTYIADLSDEIFSNLTSLERLNLSSNSISSLPAGVFSHLNRVWTLDLRSNQIADLPNGVFSNLVSLKQLYLSNNSISVVPTGVFARLGNLRELYLRHNNIQNLTVEIFSTQTTLKTVDLSDNQIKTFSATVFSNLASLTKIDLSRNNIQTMPADIKRLPHMTSLFIAGNPWRCDCSLQDLMTSERVRGSIRDDPTCGSPPHMEGISLTDVVSDTVCNGRGDCTTGSAEGSCACQVGWAGLYCDREVNVALGKKATQSSISTFRGVAEKAVDDIDKECAYTSYEDRPWWQVDLAGFYRVSRVRVLGALDLETGIVDSGKAGDVMVRVGSNENFTRNDQCGQAYIPWSRPFRRDTVYCNPPISGRYVSVQALQLESTSRSIRLLLCDVEVYVSDICCDDTIELLNGQINATDGYCSRNDIQFSCDPGYERVGRTWPTCQQNGSWSGEIPTCQKHTVPTEESRASTGAIIGGTVAGIAAALIVAAAVFMVCLRRRRKRRREQDSPQSMAHINRRGREEAIPLVPARPQFPRFETDPGRVTLGERIGRGAFGLVYRATLTRDGKTEDVVVKTVKEHASEDDKLSFLEEIRAVVDLGVHKNLLGLVGCSTVVEDHLYLITEFMPYGDLKSFLRKCREEEPSDEPQDDIYTFEVIQMYQVARQIARGMDHIARSRYVHGDLAARNVLVGKRLHVKISDFGLAEDIYSRGYRRQDRLQRVPWKWMAPERLESGEAYTTQSDVWSFGIVLYEICTLGGDPYPGVTVSELKERIQAGFRMAQPEDCPRAMYDVMLQCWRRKPAERPSFQMLELTLDKHLAFYGPEYVTAI